MNTIMVGDRVKIIQSDESFEKPFIGKTGVVVAMSIDEEMVNIVHYNKHTIGNSINHLTMQERQCIYAAVLIKFDCRYNKEKLMRVHDEFECWYTDSFNRLNIDGHIGMSACQLEPFARSAALNMFIK